MVGDTVREARESRGMTQYDLAEATGIDQPNISAIENNRRQPSVETFRTLMEGCGYELVAVAGNRTIRLPLAVEDAPGDVPDDEPLDVSMDVRRRLLVGALEGAEATVRGKAWISSTS